MTDGAPPLGVVPAAAPMSYDVGSQYGVGRDEGAMPTLEKAGNGRGTGGSAQPDEKAGAPHTRMSWARYAQFAALAFLWPCLQSSGFYPLSVVPGAESLSATNVAWWHLLYTVLIVALALVAAVCRNGTERLLVTRPAAATLLGAFGAAGNALLLATDCSTGVAEPAPAVGIALVGVFVGGAVLQSFALFPLLRSDREAALGLTASFVGSRVWMIAWLALGLPQAVQLALCPLLWAACSIAALRMGATEPPPSPEGSRAARPGAAGIPWNMVLPALVLIYFCVIFNRLRIADFSGEATVSSKMVSVAAGAILSTAALVALAVCRRVETGMVLAFSLLAAVYLAVLSVMVLQEGGGSSIARRVLIADEHGVELLVWVALARVVRIRASSPVGGGAFYLTTVVALPWALSFDAFYLTGLNTAIDFEALAVPILVVASFTTALASMAFLTLQLLRSPGAIEQSAAAGSMPGADWEHTLVERALARHGLTPRELEVATYVYRGYSAKNTADLLSVSEPTVKSYTSKIYRRLGIHSKQELIALVDDYRSQNETPGKTA